MEETVENCITMTTQTKDPNIVEQGETTWVKLFYGWNAHPGRDQTWYDRGYQNADDKSKFLKEYPANEDEALAPPKNLAGFDHDILNLMRLDCIEPIRLLDTWGAMVQASIYREFQPGKKYAAATDTSHGGGGDDAATVIVDADTGAVVADILSDQLEPEVLSMASMDLLAEYGNPIWAIERNDWGISTIKTAQDEGYPHLFHMADGNVGWLTSDSSKHDGSRFLLWGGLVSQHRVRGITVYNEKGLSQFYTVIKNPKKHSRMEAQDGAKDDYPTAVGIAFAIKHQARRARGSRRLTNTQRDGIDQDELDLIRGSRRTRETDYGW